MHWLIEAIDDLRCDANMRKSEMVRQAGVPQPDPGRYWTRYLSGDMTLPGLIFLERLLAVFGKKLVIVDMEKSDGKRDSFELSRKQSLVVAGDRGASARQTTNSKGALPTG